MGSFSGDIWAREGELSGDIAAFVNCLLVFVSIAVYLRVLLFSRQREIQPQFLVITRVRAECESRAQACRRDQQ